MIYNSPQWYQNILLDYLPMCALVQKIHGEFEINQLWHAPFFWKIDFILTLNHDHSPTPNFRPTPTSR